MRHIRCKPMSRSADVYVGEVVRQMRQQHGLKQSEMAAKLAMSASHLSRLERGYVTVPLRMLPQLAEVLRIPIRDLIPSWYLERG